MSVTDPTPELPAAPAARRLGGTGLAGDATGVGSTMSSRRAFVGRTAIGAAAAGLVWAAPSILSIDAAAAASCGAGGTINWATVTPATKPTSVTVGTVTAAITHTDPSNHGSNPDFDVNTGSFGGQSSPWYQLQMINAQTGNFQTVTFTFSTQVDNLRFTFYDIDQNQTSTAPGRWRDVVSVVGLDAANAPVAFTPSALGSSVTGTGTTANPFTATPGSGNTTGGAGNATVTFNAPVKTVTITYTAAAPRNGGGSNVGSAPWASQRIGISAMSWTGCT